MDDRYSHVLPVALNDLSNTMASFLGLNDTIQLTSQPFKTTDQPPAFDPLLFTGAIFLGFTYVIMVMGFALELISDREVISTLNTRENSYRSGTGSNSKIVTPLRLPIVSKQVRISD